MTTTLNRTTVWIALVIEKYLLPLLYLRFAVTHYVAFRGILSGSLGHETTVFIDATNQLTNSLLFLFASLLLLLGRRPEAPPQKLKLIIIPLVTAFYNLLYNTVHWFPAAWQINLSPPGLQMPLFAAGLICIVLGPIISLWGILHLGRSFGIYVAVRKVVLTGPYKWVRHPMYLGWVFLYGGLALANFSAAYFLLVAVDIALILYRARLEEIHLSAHSAEYREYMKRTRFIFPRLRWPSAFFAPKVMPGKRQ